MEFDHGSYNRGFVVTLDAGQKEKRKNRNQENLLLPKLRQHMGSLKEAKMKYKKGDKVKVKRFKTRPRNWNWTGMMDHLMGKVVTIESVSGEYYRVYDEEHRCTWSFNEDDFKPVNESIVIYRKDLEVIALNKSTGKKAIARCCPEDTFDFETGAKLAFERLTAVPLFEPKIVKQDSYEVGDKVLIKSWDQMVKEYGVDVVGDIECRFLFTKGMRVICEKVVTITSVMDKGSYRIDDEYYNISNDMIAGKVVEDTAEEPKKQLYNGKIIFTKGDGTFKTGHIYEIKNGRIKTNICTYPLGRPFKDIDDVKDYFTANAKGRDGYGWSCEDLELIEVQDD